MEENTKYAKNFCCRSEFFAAHIMKPNGLTLDITLVYDIKNYITGFLLFENCTIYTLHKASTNTITFKNLTSTTTPLNDIECTTNRIIRISFSSATDMAGTHGIIILL